MNERYRRRQNGGWQGKSGGQRSSGRRLGRVAGVSRRRFVALVGSAAAALGARLYPGAQQSVFAGPFALEEFERLVPADKKLQPEWVASLFARGEPETYSGDALWHIGMPVGGLCCGTVYLSGDGRLWHWDIFNRNQCGVSPGPAAYQGRQLNAIGGAAYVAPLDSRQPQPVEQGFTLRFGTSGGEQARSLDARGFRNVTFTGEYPIGVVRYEDPDVPVAVRLEAFSPFAPLETDESSLPVTVMSFELRNTGSDPLELALEGRLENAAGPDLRGAAGRRRNTLATIPGATLMAMTIEEAAPAGAREDILVEDWSKDGYEGWQVEGDAFGAGPVARKDVPGYQGDLGGDTARVVNSHATAPGDSIGAKDDRTGKLTSRPLRLQRKYLGMWIGGGGHEGRTCVNVVVDGRVVRSATGKNNNRMEPVYLDVSDWAGREAILEIVDAQQGAWGNIGVGRIVQTDTPKGEKFDERPGYGSMCLALLGPKADVVAGEGDVPLAERLVGTLGRRLRLAPGETATVDFLVAWHFPNVGIVARSKRHYAARWADAAAVARWVAEHFGRLAGRTRRWRDTWYDSTLPYWLLNRTMANTANLATTTCHRFADGRFWAWEGVGCCPGTCAHVWHYVQAVGRLFPELERILRERVDFGLAQHGDGAIGFRGEFGMGAAIDAQAGAILRTWREHQMSPDDAFLRRVWPGVEKAVDWLIAQDGDADGLIAGRQHNTLDADWFGPVAWLSGMYLAALRAVEEMALELGQAARARQCRDLFERGRRNLVEQLFEGDYFINRPDPGHPEAINSGTGCHIDQVLGQAWAWQVGLGRVLPEKETRSALRSLWRFNFTPDVGPYRAANRPGRWYAVAGEAGLLMCTFPRADWDYAKAAGKGPNWAAGYFNECMSGFEHQVAAHMVWEGMVLEGLAVTRAIHDRYHPARRNPYNEVECSDHYARAMASYGMFLAACGFEYHGPRGHIGFDPRLSPDNFRAAFTAAEGWGTFSQQALRDGSRAGAHEEAAGGGLRGVESGARGAATIASAGVPGGAPAGQWRANIEVRHGRLRLRSIRLVPGGTAPVATVRATLDGRPIGATHETRDGRILITFTDEIIIPCGGRLEISVAP